MVCVLALQFLDFAVQLLSQPHRIALVLLQELLQALAWIRLRVGRRINLRRRSRWRWRRRLNWRLWGIGRRIVPTTFGSVGREKYAERTEEHKILERLDLGKMLRGDIHRMHEGDGAMIGRLLCWLNIHRWRSKEVWTPSINAVFVKSWEITATCQRCGKVDHDLYEFTKTEAVR